MSDPIGARFSPNPWWPTELQALWPACHAAYRAYLEVDELRFQLTLAQPQPSNSDMRAWGELSDQAHNLWRLMETQAYAVRVAWERSRRLSPPVAENGRGEAHHG